MEVMVTFRNMDATDALKQHAESRIAKLKKYMSRPINVHMILDAQRHKNHIAEIVLSSDGARYTSKSTSSDMYSSINEAIHKLESQLREHKERMKGHKGE